MLPGNDVAAEYRCTAGRISSRAGTVTTGSAPRAGSTVAGAPPLPGSTSVGLHRGRRSTTAQLRRRRDSRLFPAALVLCAPVMGSRRLAFGLCRHACAPIGHALELGCPRTTLGRPRLATPNHAGTHHACTV